MADGQTRPNPWSPLFRLAEREKNGRPLGQAGWQAASFATVSCIQPTYIGTISAGGWFRPTAYPWREDVVVKELACCRLDMQCSLWPALRGPALPAVTIGTTANKAWNKFPTFHSPDMTAHRCPHLAGEWTATANGRRAWGSSPGRRGQPVQMQRKGLGPNRPLPVGRIEGRIRAKCVGCLDRGVDIHHVMPCHAMHSHFRCDACSRHTHVRTANNNRCVWFCFSHGHP